MTSHPVREVTRCRGCGADDLVTVLDLGDQPACDHFPPATDPGPDPTWPLALTMCRSCTLVQLDHVSPPEEEARAVESATLQRHAVDVAQRIVTRLGLPSDARVREFSSHHGGSWIGAFTAAGARRVEADADLVIDNQSIIHSEQPRTDLADRVAAMGEGGALVVEFHHALRQLESGQFDTVRHGHPLYFSLHSWSALCADAGLTIVDAWPEDVFGGCLVVVARRTGTPSPAVAEILAAEEAAGVTTPEGYARLRSQSATLRTALRDHLERARAQGRTVAAYGAGSKSCTFVGAVGLDADDLAYTADLSPAKHGRRLPGTAIPIVSPEELVQRAPDEVVILTWDIAAEVTDQLRRSGLRASFVVPLPEFRIVE